MMKNIGLLIALSTSILLSQNITVFGGLNDSRYIFNEDPNWIEGENDGFVSGYNLGVEKKLGPACIGLGLNQRGFQVRPVWNLINEIKFYRKFPKMDLSQSKKLRNSIINLPSSPEILMNR